MENKQLCSSALYYSQIFTKYELDGITFFECFPPVELIFYLTHFLTVKFYLTFYLAFYLTHILTFYLAFFAAFYLTSCTVEAHASQKSKSFPPGLWLNGFLNLRALKTLFLIFLSISGVLT